MSATKDDGRLDRVAGKAGSYRGAWMGMSGDRRNSSLPLYPFGLLRSCKRLALQERFLTAKKRMGRRFVAGKASSYGRAWMVCWESVAAGGFHAVASVFCVMAGPCLCRSGS